MQDLLRRQLQHPVAQELPGSGINGAFIYTGSCYGGAAGPFALALNSLNSGVDRRYIFQVRNGEVVSAVPEAATLVLFGSGLAAAAARRRSRRAQ